MEHFPLGERACPHRAQRGRQPVEDSGRYDLTERKEDREPERATGVRSGRGDNEVADRGARGCPADRQSCMQKAASDLLLPRLRLQTNRLAIVLCLCALLATSGHAQEIPPTGNIIPLNGATETQGPRDLYLEVFINGTSMKMIGPFKKLADDGLAAAPEELTEVGVKPEDAAETDDGLVRLDRLPDISYRIIGSMKPRSGST